MRKVQTLTVIIGLCLALLFAAPVKADLITGVEINSSPLPFNPTSTNALNYAQLVPGRVGQAVPYVLFVNNGVGEVTLQFNNPSNSLARFEYRIDGIVPPGRPAHPNPLLNAVDILYPGPNLDNRLFPHLLPPVGMTFLASDMVEIRLALGGERDWDFDWTAFKAAPAAVPEPGTLLLLGSGLLGLALTGARKKFRK